MKINYGLLIFIFVIVYAIGSTYAYIKMAEKFKTVETNQGILLNQVNGLELDKQLVLTPAEFKKSMDSATGVMLKKLDLHAKNVENVVKASSQMYAKIATVPRDTFIVRNDTLIPATTFTHSEKYLSIVGLQTKDSTTVSVKTWDSLTLLLYWKREGKFLPFIFGKKVYSGAVEGENPYITYIVKKNIKVSKR